MDNLEIWNKLNRPPKDALKQIRGGRLKGMTDINPQWRYQMMTEHFGPCGVGWKYEIVRTWAETASDGQIAASVEIKLYVAHDGKWCDPIPGIGGSMMVAKESAGLHSSDEAYKMATTDALSVAMKMLGVAADIYKGLWDGSKYKDAPPEGKKPEPKKKQKDGNNQMTSGQRKFIKDLGYKLHELTESEVADMVKWKANQQNLDPNHWKVAKIFLGDKPEENYTAVFQEYCEFQSNIELKEPF